VKTIKGYPLSEPRFELTTSRILSSHPRRTTRPVCINGCETWSYICGKSKHCWSLRKRVQENGGHFIEKKVNVVLSG
jgi:hypothetical protein